MVNILKKLIYIILVLYALAMFGAVIMSGAVMAIIFAAIVIGYIITMFISMKSIKRLQKIKERLIGDSTYRLERGQGLLLHAMIANLPFYFIYFVFSLVPYDFPAFWFIAGLPCCVISALRPINKNYQLYNYITNKGRLYWTLQLILAIVLWAIGRTIILLGVLGE